eukprot:6492105-Amphidinium_carterae.2
MIEGMIILFASLPWGLATNCATVECNNEVKKRLQAIRSQETTSSETTCEPPPGVYSPEADCRPRNRRLCGGSDAQQNLCIRPR